MPLFGRRTSLVTLVEEYCGIIKQRSGGTKKSWRTDQNRLREAARLLGVEYVEAISRQAVARALDAKEAQDVSPTTVNAFREILCRFLNWALRERGVKFNDTGLQNPVAMIRRRKEPDHEIVFLTDEQVVRLLEGLVDPELRAMVAVILFAGLRRGEVVWLTVDDVDVAIRLIRVRAKEVGGARWQPKTGRTRNVPISERLMAELALYQRPTGSVWFFPSPLGCRWDEDNWSKRLCRATRGLGIKVGALACRHTFGTTLAKRDVSLLKISKLMGNSPEIVRKHYAHVMPEELRDEIELAALPTSIPVPRPAAERAPLPVPAPMLVPPPIPAPQAAENACPAEPTPVETAEAFPAANDETDQPAVVADGSDDVDAGDSDAGDIDADDGDADDGDDGDIDGEDADVDEDEAEDEGKGKDEGSDRAAGAGSVGGDAGTQAAAVKPKVSFFQAVGELILKMRRPSGR